MSSIKKFVIRCLCVLAFVGTMVLIMQYVVYFVTVNNADKTLTNVIEKANTMLMSNNVISIDKVDEKSDMVEFLELLRASESTYVKFDIDYYDSDLTTAGVTKMRVTNNKDIKTKHYEGTTAPESAIKMYTKDSRGIIATFNDYETCPQRGELVYCEITMNIYIPKFVVFPITNRIVPSDTWALEHNMFLQKNTETASAIGIKYYKGKS